MTAFILFAVVLVLLATAIIWSAVRSGAREEPSQAERRDAAIEALRQLELERGTGMLTEEEYAEIRARLAGEALRARDAAARAGGPRAGGRCPACGATGEEGALFCPRCGAEMAPGEGERDPG